LTNDKSAPKDFIDFCTNTGHELVNIIKEKDYNKIEIKRINFEK
jgi:TusA-related sulfurtransferase